jgi:hypothetical protein
MLDTATVQSVQAVVGEMARCLVVDGSARFYETTIAALRGFVRFVPVGGFLIVEDGCVESEDLRIDPAWPRRLCPAIGDWVAMPEGRCVATPEGRCVATPEGRRSTVCECDLYGVNCHPGGLLRRRC